MDTREVKFYWNQHKYELKIPLEKSTNVSNINVTPGYNKFQVYCQQRELGPDMNSEPLINDTVSVKISNNKVETNRQANPARALKESETPTQSRMNQVKETDPGRQPILVVDEE